MQQLKCFLNTTVGFLLCCFISEKVLSLPLSETPKVEELGNHYQGDIVRPPAIVSDRGVGTRPKAANRWAGGIVPYEFADNISTTNAIYIVQMMRQIERLTSVNGTQCVAFRPKVLTDRIFITIFNGTGCYAPVGTWPGWNGLRPVSLMDASYGTCIYTGIIQHELTHVLGMYHEQSRPDRDDYIDVNWDNIDRTQRFNFDKYTDDEVDTQMTSYDYGSVMHYDRFAFAVDWTKPTITPTKNTSAFIGQRQGLSPTDIIEIQRYYDCIPTPDAKPLMTTTTTRPTTTADVNAYTRSTRNSFSHSVSQFSPSFVVFLLLLLWNH